MIILGQLQKLLSSTHVSYHLRKILFDEFHFLKHNILKFSRSRTKQEFTMDLLKWPIAPQNFIVFPTSQLMSLMLIELNSSTKFWWLIDVFQLKNNILSGEKFFISQVCVRNYLNPFIRYAPLKLISVAHNVS